MKVPRFLFIGIYFFIIAVCLGQEQCLKDAWRLYTRKNWDTAINHAGNCVALFNSKAIAIQDTLKMAKCNLPTNYDKPHGLRAQQKEEIFSHGLLNDVATSYWIIGMSNIHLNRIAEARTAFQKAISLSFGLCYDPMGDFFWSPSESARLKLDQPPFN
jgi:hypothetical protein